MDATGTLRMLIGQLPGTLPVLIALAVGLALVLQARELPHPARRLGLLGFGLLLGTELCGIPRRGLLYAPRLEREGELINTRDGQKHSE